MEMDLQARELQIFWKIIRGYVFKGVLIMQSGQEHDLEAIEKVLVEYIKKNADNKKRITDLTNELEWYKFHNEQTENSLAFRVGQKLSRMNKMCGSGIVLKTLRKVKHKLEGREDVMLVTEQEGASQSVLEAGRNYENLLSLPEYEFYKYKENREKFHHIFLENIQVPCKKDVVSVILPVYNGGSLLKESIESVLNQTYTNFELIIVNDGSTDSTAEVIDFYAAKDKRIKAIHKKNEKLPKTLSRGFREATGEFFTWTSADNIMEPEFLELLVGEMKKYSDLGMVYANIKLIDEKGDTITSNQWYAEPKNPENVIFPRCILRLNTYADNYIGAAFMYRADVARIVGDYSACRYCIEDYDYWMRINDLFQLRHSDFEKSIYQYRFHSASLTARDKELKITENRYQEMLWENFRRDYFLKPLCWIIDGDYNDSKIFKEFQESIIGANHKIIYADELEEISVQSIYEQRIYIKFPGKKKLQGDIDSVYRVLIVSLEEVVENGYDCYIDAYGRDATLLTAENYIKWFYVRSGKDAFGIIDAKAKGEFLYDMEKVSTSDRKYKYDVSVILPFTDEKEAFCQCIDTLREQDFSKSKYELIVIGEREKRTEILKLINHIQKKELCVKYVEAVEPNITTYINTGFWASQGKYINILNPIYRCNRSYIRKIADTFKKNPEGSFFYIVENGEKAESLCVEANELYMIGGFLKLATGKNKSCWSGWEESVPLKLQKHGRKEIPFSESLVERSTKENIEKSDLLYEKYRNYYELELRQLRPYNTWIEQIESEISKEKEILEREEEPTKVFHKIKALEQFNRDLKKDYKEREQAEKERLSYTLHPTLNENKLKYLQSRETEEPWVSVIVPVYKVEDYLEHCVDSIRLQTLNKIEIILVDDGSPDNCPQLCDQFAEMDGRIRVIHKENGGLSDARNAGIAEAKGKYISFIDSDDWIEKRMYEELCYVAEKFDAEIAESSFRYVYSDTVKEELYNTGTCVVLDNLEALKEEMKWRYFKSVAWNKIYRKELFDMGIRYPKGKYHEDEFTTYRLLYAAKKLVYLDRVMYNYVQREDSITGIRFNENGLDAVEAWWNKVVFYKEQGLYDLYEKALEMYCWVALDRLEKCEENNVRGCKVEQVKENLKNHYNEMVIGKVPEEYLEKLLCVLRIQ